jgi:hypothetical protein
MIGSSRTPAVRNCSVGAEAPRLKPSGREGLQRLVVSEEE